MWLRSGTERYMLLARFWTKICAVSFGMGVVSGIVLSYQFGTNWSRFSVIVGNVVGPLIGYEVLTAFFLEATFLGIMLFGFNRVPPWLYVLSSAIVAVGTAISAFWILAANSWMHTPTGHAMQNGIAIPVDWIAIVFNPSFPYRFALEAEGVPCAPVLTREQVISHPQVRASNLLLESEHPVAGPLRQTRAPARFSKTPPELRHGAPLLGEHNAAVLSELGLSHHEIEALSARGIIGGDKSAA
jgi:hypothetical protein